MSSDPSSELSSKAPRRPAGRRSEPARRDAARNYHLILDAARDVLGESGAEASMEQIAARAGVGVGTVYRHFTSKDALIDELLQLALDQTVEAAEHALDRTDGHGLEEFLRALGQSFASHARYASLLLERSTDDTAARWIRAAIGELTARAAAAGLLDPGVTADDVMALVMAMRGLVQATGEATADTWQRFLDLHLAGMRTARPPAAPARPAGYEDL
jgi:AcrR family transcriptional regulator